jgi:CsoR family transcriptional regulator, copper-sensing transcriptional repressor
MVGTNSLICARESSTGLSPDRRVARSVIPPLGILEAMESDDARKKELQARLRRIEGQVRGLQRMVDQDQYCVDILTQVNSATAALRAVGIELLDEHVHRCVLDGDGGDRVEEVLAAVARFTGR